MRCEHLIASGVFPYLIEKCKMYIMNLKQSLSTSQNFSTTRNHFSKELNLLLNICYITKIITRDTREPFLSFCTVFGAAILLLLLLLKKCFQIVGNSIHCWKSLLRLVNMLSWLNINCKWCNHYVHYHLFGVNIQHTVIDDFDRKIFNGCLLQNIKVIRLFHGVLILCERLSLAIIATKENGKIYIK